MLASILPQLWLDLAVLAGEENQVGTSFSLSLSLTARRFFFIDTKEAGKQNKTKQKIHSCESMSQAPLRSGVLLFVSNPWNTMFTSSF